MSLHLHLRKGTLIHDAMTVGPLKLWDPQTWPEQALNPSYGKLKALE